MSQRETAPGHNSRPAGSVMTLLLVGVLLLALLAIVLVFVPLAPCPYCKEAGVEVAGRSGVRSSFMESCSVCNDTGKVALLSKWSFLRNAPAR